MTDYITATLAKAEAGGARPAELAALARRLEQLADPQAGSLPEDSLKPLGDLDSLDECLTSGMLVHGVEGVAFRHELARIAVEDSLSPTRRLALHRRALPALAKLLTLTPSIWKLFWPGSLPLTLMSWVPLPKAVALLAPVLVPADRARICV